MSGFNYSKWDNIVLSDDEEDMHPNIDRNLMIRLKREKREREEAAEKAERAKIADLDTPEAEARRKVLDDKIRFHSDQMCVVTSERTFVNKKELHAEPKPSPKSLAAQKAEEAPKSEEEQFEEYDSYVKKHDATIEKWLRSTSLDRSEEFIKDHPELLNDHALGSMLLKMLEMQMQGKNKTCERAVRQYLVAKNIMDLVQSARGGDPRMAVGPFFRQMAKSEHQERLSVEVKDFNKKIKARAMEKLEQKKQEEAAGEGGDAHYEEVELSAEERLGPGGLDPVVVYQELPESIQQAFEAKDMQMLQNALQAMELSKAKEIMDKCAKSGLWVPDKAAYEAEKAAEASN